MNNTMEYKGYVGSVEFSEEDCTFFGKIIGIRALLSYEGSTAAELVSDFHGAVDDYLALCEAEGCEPEKAFNGAHFPRALQKAGGTSHVPPDVVEQLY